MDRDGVNAEVLFPAAVGRRNLHAMEPEAQVAAVKGYNDWLSTVFTAADPDRLLGVALLPATRLRDSINEMERVSALPGIWAVVLQQWPNGSGAPIPTDDRFWEAALDLRMPLTAWKTFGGGAAASTRPPQFTGLSQMMPLPIAMVGAFCVTQSQLITEGVLDRHPSLQILFAGLNIGWIPSEVEYADDTFMRHRYQAGYPEHHTQQNYFPKHFKWTFTKDPFGVKVRHDIGVDNILWSSDFPHEASKWPNSGQLLKEELAEVPEGEAGAIAGGNAAAFFHLGV
jgi:predicted TIM-barrel fold metal-dependent hydrolase